MCTHWLINVKKGDVWCLALLLMHGSALWVMYVRMLVCDQVLRESVGQWGLSSEAVPGGAPTLQPCNYHLQASTNKPTHSYLLGYSCSWNWEKIHPNNLVSEVGYIEASWSNPEKQRERNLQRKEEKKKVRRYPEAPPVFFHHQQSANSGDLPYPALPTGKWQLTASYCDSWVNQPIQAVYVTRFLYQPDWQFYL